MASDARAQARAAGSEAVADRLRDAWQAIADAEQARGAALSAGGDAVAAQAIYEAALDTFRLAQIDAFTVALGYVPLMWEQLESHGQRLAAMHAAIAELRGAVAQLERAVGERDPSSSS
jgi:dihydrofolate reductase